MKFALLIVILFNLLYSNTPDNIYSLIEKGRLKEASDSLSTLATASTRNGDILYLQSLLEPDGEKSVQLLNAALKASVSIKYQEDIYYRLSQYYLLKEDYVNLNKIVSEYLTRWEDSRYEKEFIRYSILIDEENNKFESALNQVDRSLLKWNNGDVTQLTMIDKARIMNENNKRVGAEKMLRKLSREKKGPGISQAMYILANEAIKMKRTDDAVFYYNIFREEFPSAVGLDALIGKLSRIDSDNVSSGVAEKLTGTYFSVKVGVFSSKKNANKMADKFKKFDKKVDIKSKTISGKKYRVVYIGRFSTYIEAQQFKDQLETTFDEVFQVVAR